MPWHTLLDPSHLSVLALVTTTTDRVMVWGAVALVIGLIAWRELTLPEVAPAPRPAEHPGAALADGAPGDEQPEPAVSRPIV